MRLKEKLIRKKCPACGAEITMGASSLNKKINCPKCRQTVVVPAEDAPEKPAPQKKRAVEKRTSRVPAPPKPLAVAEEPRLFAPEEPAAPEISFHSASPENSTNPPKTNAVVYCLCNGVIKRSGNVNGFCSAPGVCCIYANLPGS